MPQSKLVKKLQLINIYLIIIKCFRNSQKKIFFSKKFEFFINLIFFSMPLSMTPMTIGTTWTLTTDFPILPKTWAWTLTITTGTRSTLPSGPPNWEGSKIAVESPSIGCTDRCWLGKVHSSRSKMNEITLSKCFPKFTGFHYGTGTMLSDCPTDYPEWIHLKTGTTKLK